MINANRDALGTTAQALGKQVRLRTIFNHPSGRILAIAADHMINYRENMPEGLRNLESTLMRIVEGQPNSLTINKGVALRYGRLLAGRLPFIIQQMALPGDMRGFAAHAAVEEVVAMGAVAVAVSIFVKGPGELEHIGHLGKVVREASVWGLPVIPHIYPLKQQNSGWTVTHAPEDLYFAVRVGFEMGADVIKVPFTGDAASFRDVIASIPVPVVTAGGPKCDTLEEAEAMMTQVAASGAAGATVGRNVWGFPDVPEAIRRLKAALLKS
jgi:DhnA family fructose-bisphosphate aldolase class Ia